MKPATRSPSSSSGSLHGETIEDVAYDTFNAWGIGKAGEDNGVLLVIAPAEREVRIETGKGIGGALTDLEASHIIRDHIAPHLKEDRFVEAIDAGTDAIERALREGGQGAPASQRPSDARSAPHAFAGAPRWVAASTTGLVLLFYSVVLVTSRRSFASGGEAPPADDIDKERTAADGGSGRRSWRWHVALLLFCLPVGAALWMWDWTERKREDGTSLIVGACLITLLCSLPLWLPPVPWWFPLSSILLSIAVFVWALAETRCSACRRLLSRRERHVRLEVADLDELLSPSTRASAPAPDRALLDTLAAERSAAEEGPADARAAKRHARARKKLDRRARDYGLSRAELEKITQRAETLSLEPDDALVESLRPSVSVHLLKCARCPERKLLFSFTSTHGGRAYYAGGRRSGWWGGRSSDWSGGSFGGGYSGGGYSGGGGRSGGGGASDSY